MNYTRTICDKCGKEITDKDWKIQFKRDVRVSEFATLFQTVRQLEKTPCKTYDLCEKCSKDLDKFMSNRSK